MTETPLSITMIGAAYDDAWAPAESSGTPTAAPIRAIGHAASGAPWSSSCRSHFYRVQPGGTGGLPGLHRRRSPAGLTFDVQVDDAVQPPSRPRPSRWSVRIGLPSGSTRRERAGLHQRVRARVIEAYRTHRAFCRLRTRSCSTQLIPRHRGSVSPSSNGSRCKLPRRVRPAFLTVRPDFTIEVATS